MARRRPSVPARSAWNRLPFLPVIRGLPAARTRTSRQGTAAQPVPGRVPRVRPPRRVTVPRPVAPRRSPGRWLSLTHSGPAGSRSYEVYLPAGHRRTTRVPLLLLLHGCDQTPQEFVAATRFTALADRHGFVLVAPRQSRTYHPGGCWRWYAPAHQSRGAGEPAVLAGIVAAMLAEPTRWRIDPSRVYVAGISAGAGMALILGATYPDVFAAVGVHSGTAYRSATSTRAALGAMSGRAAPPPADPSAAFPPLIVFQGVADRVVVARNGDQVTEQWLAHDAVRAPSRPDGRAARQDHLRIRRSRTVERRSSDGRRFTVTRWYTARGRKRMEYWRIDGLGHAWSGGLRDGSYSDPRGPRASTAMWSFFAAHRL